MQFNIITPSFNQDKFLFKTILSVLKQKGDFKLNYWVMDGGSSDKTKQILNIFKHKINFESKKDKGQSHAINKGILEFKKNINTKNQVFAFINSDDYYLPNAFSIVKKAFEKNPDKKWLIADCQIVDENGKQIQKLISLYKKIWRFLPLKYSLPLLNPIAQPAVFIRQETLLKTGFFNEKLNFVMDYEYWHRLLSRYPQPIKLESNIAAFRIHKKSKGGSEFLQQFEEQLKVADKFVKIPLLLNIHKWHNSLIITIYRTIK